MKKLWAYWSQGMHAIILCRILCLPGCYLKIQRLRYTELNFACCCVCVWNLVTYTEGGMKPEGVWEYDTKENILAYVG
jgi:hypothetical protein